MVGIDRERLRYTDIFYWAWTTVQVLCLIAALWAGPLLGHWDVALMLVVAAITCRNSARLEQMDGHRHSGNDVNVPR